MYSKIKRIHLVGIGGIGMSGIAQLLLRHGYTVTGSDLKRGESVRQLEQLGIRVFEGHRSDNIQDAELVVYSSAVKDSNPELLASRDREILVIPRADMLAELMRLKHGIAVAGTHGKTTTTSMIGTVLLNARLDPTIVVGGRMDNIGGSNARLGSGKFMVVEADESDGSFNKLNPSIAVVTNLDREHMDHYRTMPNLKKAFVQFLNRVPFYGISILCGDDPNLRLILRKIVRRKITYGFKSDNSYFITDYHSSEKGSEFRVKYQKHTESVKLRVPGKHNALNAVAALAVSDELSLSRSHSLEGLFSFTGVQRRFQFRGNKSGFDFFDDYAHHPIEIHATLSAARERFPRSKIWVVFQPHRYSRVEDLFDQFGICFRHCDGVAVLDIYAAGEEPIPGIHSDLIVENIQKNGHTTVFYAKDPLSGIDSLLSLGSRGDVIFTLGAGDISNVYSKLF